MTEKQRRPNILFLMTDQQRHDALGCVNPVIRTPALDALAGRGVRFSEAVCNVPMCVPSRYSLMTGLYGSQLGVRHNTQMAVREADLPSPCVARTLLEAGYQTVGFGKTHWYIGPSVMPGVAVEGSRFGFEVRALRGKAAKDNTEPGSLYRGDVEPEWEKRINEEAAKAGPGGESVTGYIGETSAISAGHHAETWLTDQALDFLDNKRDSSRPFFLYLSLDYPHVGLHVPEGFEDLYRLEDFPDNPPPDPVPGGHMQGHRFETLWKEMSPEQRRRSRLRYAALCTYVDAQFDRVLKKIEDMGETENTLVLFISDHGDMLGDRGRVSKYCLYEGSVRVPLILAGPGVTAGVDERNAELVDVVPTLLRAAGLQVSENLPGLDLLGGRKRPGSFAEMHGRGYEEYQRAPAVMYRTKEWKLILHLPGALGSAFPSLEQISGEFYCLGKDPLELVNRYEDSSCAEIRHELTVKLLMHVMCVNSKQPFASARAKITVTGPETKPDKSIWERP